MENQLTTLISSIKFTNDVFKQIKEKAESAQDGWQLNASSLIKLTTDVIFVIQQESAKYPRLFEILTGADKKNVAMIVIKMFIKESKLENNDKLFMLTMLETFISPTIDMLIKVSKKKIDLGLNTDVDNNDANKTAGNAGTNTGCCFPFTLA